MLIRRSDLPLVVELMFAAGFRHHVTMDVDMFLDGPDGTPRDAVQIVFANEKVRDEYTTTAPDVDDSEHANDFAVLSLEALVTMKLTSFRDKDRTHLRDMIAVGLVDASWCSRFSVDLAGRLQELINNPDG